MMSIGTWDRVQFLVYLLNLSFAHETWKNNRYAHGGNIVRKNFAWFEGLGPPFYLPTHCNQWKTNYDEFAVFYSFEGVPWDNQSNKYHLIKINMLHYTVLLSKSKNSLELVSSLHNRAKNQFEKVVIGCTNPWPSFILILLKVLKK